MASELLVRRLSKSDERAIERLLVDDVYGWRRWVFVSLKHGIFSIFPKQISVLVLFLVSICAASGRLDAAVWTVIALLCFICITSWLKMASFIRFIRNVPEFAESNLAEKYSGEGSAFFVAELGDKIVGCVGVKKRNEEEGDLFRMAVSSTAQRLGVGKLLIRSATDFAAKSGYRGLVLDTSHIFQAHLFYLRVGFRIRDVKTYWFFKVLPACIYEMVHDLT